MTSCLQCLILICVRPAWRRGPALFISLSHGTEVSPPFPPLGGSSLASLVPTPGLYFALQRPPFGGPRRDVLGFLGLAPGLPPFRLLRPALPRPPLPPLYFAQFSTPA